MADRAPRLGPQERIAPFMTRRGRFVKVNPLRTRPPIGLARLLGLVGWAALVGESFRRARRQARAGSTRGQEAP